MTIEREFLEKIHKGAMDSIDPMDAIEATPIIATWDYFKPITMEYYKKFSPKAWSIASNRLGVYQIITQELVDFIRHLIQGDKAIEICCGSGALGRALKIPLVDRMLEKEVMEGKLPEIAPIYKLNRINSLGGSIHYGSDVIQMTANKAFREYKPKWVMGCWVTARAKKPINGNSIGPVESHFVNGANYIHMGSEHLDIHVKKEICKKPHYIIKADWLVSKSSHKAESMMQIWTKQELDFDSFPSHLEFDYFLPNK